MAAKSRKGYTVTTQGGGEDGLGRPISETIVVVRNEDGTGLGAFSTDEEVDLAISEDREYLSSRDSEQPASTDSPASE